MDGTSQQGQQKTLEADVVRAKQFEVVLDGKVVATLKGVETKAGKKALGIYGEGETLIAVLDATPDGGRLDIYNKDGKFVVRLAANPDGGGLDIYNKDEKSVAWLDANPDGGGLGLFTNKGGPPVAGLNATPDGGKFILLSPDGRELFSAP